MGAKVVELPEAFAPLVFLKVFGREWAPRMGAQCKDCAFHTAGSPEQADVAKWGAILRSVDEGTGFYCHQGMPMEGDAYKPYVDADGVPMDYRLCAGWVEMRRRFLAVRRADNEDAMNDVVATDTFVVAATAAVFSFWLTFCRACAGRR